MDHLQDFLNMGGYGGYVWPAYGLTAVVMVGFLISSLRGLRMARRALEVQESRTPSHRRRTKPRESEA